MSDSGRASTQHAAPAVRTHPFPVDAGARHGIERIADAHDAREARDPVAGQPVRVPAAVDSLVVTPHDRRAVGDHA